jgi:hypothetical protein
MGKRNIMNNGLVVQKIADLEEAIKKATDAAAKLLRCAESISNPTYIVTMEGRELEILAASHTAGTITLRVKSPFTNIDLRGAIARAQQNALGPADV